jgi:signal recognition particle receptor subunit beta
MTSIHRLREESGIQRVGEIVVVGPPGAEKQPFLSSLCPHVEITNQDIILGRLPIHDELMLYCYGVSYGQGFAWDLVGRKMLGYVILFDWFDDASFAASKEIIEFTASYFSAPFIIAGDLGDRPHTVPESAVRPYIGLSTMSKFMFCRSSKPASVRKVVATLLDLLIEKLD